MPITLRSVAIEGPFTEPDWQRVLDLIREIEREHPGETYRVAAVDPETHLSKVNEWGVRALPRSGCKWRGCLFGGFYFRRNHKTQVIQ
jgi:hypothetical protein